MPIRLQARDQLRIRALKIMDDAVINVLNTTLSIDGPF